MLIVGYVFAIRSERPARVLRCRSIWPIGGFASSASRMRYRIIRCSAVRGTSASARALAWRRVFEGLFVLFFAAGQVKGEAFSVDARPIPSADVGRKQWCPGHQPIAWPKTEEAPLAVREYLAALDAAGSD